MTDIEVVREALGFLTRRDYDWVEDWEEARELAARAKPALASLEAELARVEGENESMWVVIDAAKAERAELARYREALERIKRDCGAVCPDFMECQHPWCSASAGAYLVATDALTGETEPPMTRYEAAVKNYNKASAELDRARAALTGETTDD